MLTEAVRECALVDRELDRQFEDRNAIASEHLSRHLDECERCRHLYRWMLEAPVDTNKVMEKDRLNLYRNIQDILKDSARPVRVLPSSGILVLQFWVVFLLFAALAAATAGIAGVRQMDLMQTFGMSIILLLGTALLSLSLVWQMIPGSLQRYPAMMILPILSAGFLLGIASLFPWHAYEAFLAQGWRCLSTGFLLSGVAAFPFWLFARRGATLSIGAMGATLGACAGLVSVTVLQSACSHQDLGHLLVWHGPVLVGSILSGLGIAVSHARCLR
jgi:hypothetical protein